MTRDANHPLRASGFRWLRVLRDRMRNLTKHLAVRVGIIALVLVMAFLFYRSHAGGGLSWAAPSSAGAAFPGRGKLFLTSLALAGCASLLGLILGFPTGVHLGRARSLRLAPIFLVPLFVPPHLSAYIWRFTLEDLARTFTGKALWASQWTSFLGAAWTFAAIYWPLVALPVALTLRARGNRIEQELATLAPPRAVFRRAIVPALVPAALAGAGVLFLFALAGYGVPLMWNIPAQSVAVFGRLTATYEAWPALRLSLPLQITVLAVCGFGVFLLTRRPYGLDLTQSVSARPLPRSRGFSLCGAISGLVILATIVAPLVSLLTCPGVFTRVRLTFLEGAGPYGWGLAMAALGATGATALGTLLAFQAKRGRLAELVIEAVGLCALFVPAAVFCIGLTALAAGPRWLRMITDTFAVFLVAYGVRFFYLPYKLVRVFHTVEGPAYRDLERSLGLGMCTRLRLAFGGLLRPALCAGWLLVFALALGELEIAGFRVQAGRQPMSVFLENLMHYGRSSTVVQWSLLLILTEMVLAFLILRIGWPRWRRSYATI